MAQGLVVGCLADDIFYQTNDSKIRVEVKHPGLMLNRKRASRVSFPSIPADQVVDGAPWDVAQ